MAATGKRHFPHTTPDTAGDAVYQEITGGSAHVHEQGLLAGERNVDSNTNGYSVTRHEAAYTIVDHADTSPVSVSAGARAHIFGVMCTEAFAGTPDFALYDGATEVFNCPTAMALGDVIEFPAAIDFATDIDVVIAAAGTAGKIVVLWKAY